MFYCLLCCKSIICSDTLADHLPRLGKRELNFLVSITRNHVSVPGVSSSFLCLGQAALFHCGTP